MMITAVVLLAILAILSACVGVALDDDVPLIAAIVLAVVGLVFAVAMVTS